MTAVIVVIVLMAAAAPAFVRSLRRAVALADVVTNRGRHNG